MSTDASFSDWDWEDTPRLDETIGEIHDGLARCEKLEPTPIAEPYSRELLTEVGLTGIEFAAWKTAHPAGIASDIIPLRSPEASSERGRLYRVDGERYFVELDVVEELPFAAGSLDWVYAEHMIEHLTVPVAIGWLREVRRVLAPGGVLRLTTPDLGKYVAGYLGDGFFETHRHEVYAAGLGPPMPARRAFMFNQIFYLYGHRWIYDLDELRYVLTAAGFDPGRLRQRSYRDGARADVAALDRAVRQDETVYVEVTT